MVKYLTVEKRGRFTEAQESKKAGAGVGKKMEFNPFRTPRVVLVYMERCIHSSLDPVSFQF